MFPKLLLLLLLLAAGAAAPLLIDTCCHGPRHSAAWGVNETGWWAPGPHGRWGGARGPGYGPVCTSCHEARSFEPIPGPYRKLVEFNGTVIASNGFIAVVAGGKGIVHAVGLPALCNVSRGSWVDAQGILIGVKPGEPWMLVRALTCMPRG